MQLVHFESSQVEPTADERVVIALFDGDLTKSLAVPLLSCSRETAAALTQQLGSVLKLQSE